MPDCLDQEICVERQRIMFGLNDICIRARSILDLVLFQITRPFFIFQILCVIIWWCEEYKLYAICIFLITIQSLISTVQEVKGNSKKLKEISKMNQPVTILRNSQWVQGLSEDLVPGDRFSLDPSLKQIPCDAILIKGDILVDESMLTGETTPVIKGAAESHLLATKSASQLFKNSKFGLFAGTRLVTSRSAMNDAPLALVYRTGTLISLCIVFLIPFRFSYSEGITHTIPDVSSSRHISISQRCNHLHRNHGYNRYRIIYRHHNHLLIYVHL